MKSDYPGAATPGLFLQWLVLFASGLIRPVPAPMGKNCIDSTMTAAAPRCAAASATAASAARAATGTAKSTTTTCTAAAAAHRYLREAAGAVFLVEDVECSKTHVGYFLFAKNEALIGCGAQRLRKVRSRKSGCASHQRKTQSGSA
jgi:hypothetical protein